VFGRRRSGSVAASGLPQLSQSRFAEQEEAQTAQAVSTINLQLGEAVLIVWGMMKTL
jgi:hypothetical protein